MSVEAARLDRQAHPKRLCGAMGLGCLGRVLGSFESVSCARQLLRCAFRLLRWLGVRRGCAGQVLICAPGMGHLLNFPGTDERRLEQFFGVLYPSGNSATFLSRRPVALGTLHSHSSQSIAKTIERGSKTHRHFMGSSAGGSIAWRGGVLSRWPGVGKTRGRGKHSGNSRFRFGEERGGRVDQSSHDLCRSHGGGLEGLVVIEHPAGEERFGRFLDPLVDQRGDFLTKVRGVIEPRELKALQRGARSGLQVIERRREPSHGHGQSSCLWLGPKGPAVPGLVNSTHVSRSVSRGGLWICCG